MTDKHNKNRPKPDDRSDNAEKLESMVEDTMENIDEANETIQYASVEGKEQIEAKNKRREAAIEEMQNEIKDESNYSE